jgi:hypothetical protein
MCSPLGMLQIGSCMLMLNLAKNQNCQFCGHLKTLLETSQACEFPDLGTSDACSMGKKK